MKSSIQDKNRLVNSVFGKVYKKYDLMNDVMSLGVHRIWKSRLIDWMNPQMNETLIDVASGTGDIAKLFSKRHNHLVKISCVEPNYKMYEIGKTSGGVEPAMAPSIMKMLLMWMITMSLTNLCIVTMISASKVTLSYP